MAVMPVVTAGLVHYSALDTGTNVSAVSSGLEGKWRLCLQLLQYWYITVLWDQGLTVVLLVQGGGEMAVMPAVTTVLVHYSAMGTGTDGSAASSG